MSIDIYWRVGTHGDQPSLRRRTQSRGGFVDVPVPGQLAPGLRDGVPDGYSYADHVADVVRASEAAGFVGGLLPSFPGTDDPWALAASLAQQSRTYRFMVAYQPGFLHPVQAARLTASLQAATGGRIVYNVISGGGGPAQLWWGDKVSHDDRYARTSEFLDVLKGVWAGDFSYEGRFYRVEGAGLPKDLAGQPFPEIYFSGSSPAAIEAAGRHADYYLSWLEPFDALAAKFAQVRTDAAALGRTPRFAVRLDVLARPTEEQAWDEIRRGFENLGPEALRAFEGGGDSVGAARSRGFTGDPSKGYRGLEVAPNVWGGFHLLRGGPVFGLVGSYHQVAQRLDELIGLGVDAFILAGVPHLEEAHRIGENVLPLLARDHDITIP